jgi:type IV pilus assembly protein PilC
MANLSYKLVTKNGQIKTGSISALTKRGAEKTLSKDGSIVIFISSKDRALWQKELSLPWSGFSSTEKINFFRNLSMMSSAGISIVESLMLSIDEIKSNKVKEAIKVMAQNTKNGQRLSKTMAQFPKYFSEAVVETIHMGEFSGELSQALDRIANDLEKNVDIRRKITSALAYPAIIVAVMIVIATILLLYVLPEIGKIYREMNIDLPLPTKIILSTGNFLTLHLHILLLIAAGIVIIPPFLLKIKKIHYAFDYLILKIPVFGNLIKEYNLVIFFRSIGSLIKTGVSLVDSVDVAKKTVNNDVYEGAFDNIYPILLRGVPFSDTLIRFPFLFSTQTRKIIEVGERTGKLDNSFIRITNYYENSLEHKTKMMATLIEPVLMLILGVVVGGLAISIFYPIYNLVSVI